MEREAVERVENAINAAIDAQSDGNQSVVPVAARAAIAEVIAILGEPTSAMLNAGEAEQGDCVGDERRFAYETFKSMLSASPLSQGGQE
jgi:hypothetical protein